MSTPATPSTGLTTAASLIETSLTLLQLVAASYPATSQVGQAAADAALVEQAIANLLKVQGSPVTWEQLNGLRITKTW